MVASEIGGSLSVFFFVDDPEAHQTKILFFPPKGGLNQEFKGSFRRLELVSPAFQVLDPTENLIDPIVVPCQLDAVILGLV